LPLYFEVIITPIHLQRACVDLADRKDQMANTIQVLPRVTVFVAIVPQSRPQTPFQTPIMLQFSPPIIHNLRKAIIFFSVFFGVSIIGNKQNLPET
jgi:hypothetical protein